MTAKNGETIDQNGCVPCVELALFLGFPRFFWEERQTHMLTQADSHGSSLMQAEVSLHWSLPSKCRPWSASLSDYFGVSLILWVPFLWDFFVWLKLENKRPQSVPFQKRRGTRCRLRKFEVFGVLRGRLVIGYDPRLQVGASCAQEGGLQKKWEG